MSDNLKVRVAVAPGNSGNALLCELGADGGPLGSPVKVHDLPRAIGDYEQAAGDRVRWVWSSTAQLYPALLRAGVRVGRCHDVGLAEALLAGRDAPAKPPPPSGATFPATAPPPPPDRV